MLTQPEFVCATAARPDRSDVPDDVPRRLDRWQLTRLLHNGSLSRIYLAQPFDVPADGAPAAAYAVKVMQPAWENDPRAVALFRREAALGRQLGHPNLIGVLASHVSAPPYYLVMPYLEGQTLAEYRRGSRPLAANELLWIVRQTAEALEYLDRQGLIHGDIKPANIHVSPSGHVTLLDLGFSRRVGGGGTGAGSVGEQQPLLGTANYLAPELIVSALGADIRSDLYSLGVTMYEMLAGRLPFEAADLAALATLHMQAAPASLRGLAPQTSPELAQLVHALLAKNPLRRPQSPSELVERLMRLEMDAMAELALL